MKIKLLILACFFKLAIYGQTAMKDTLFTRILPNTSGDTFRMNVLANDTDVIKAQEWHINCKRYPCGTTWRSIKNFGKIKFETNGNITFVSVKYTSTPMTSFVYTGASTCGTSQTSVVLLDSAYKYVSDNTKVYGYHSEYGFGYYIKEGDKYYIQYDRIRQEVTRQEYEYAFANSAR